MTQSCSAVYTCSLIRLPGNHKNCLGAVPSIKRVSGPSCDSKPASAPAESFLTGYIQLRLANRSLLWTGPRSPQDIYALMTFVR